MATKFQIKRTSVSGRTPNTTNSANSSYIAAGELALNLTDKKMYSSNGTNYFEIGSFKVELVNSTSNVSTFTEISTLQFDEDSGFDVTNPSSGIAKVAINSTFKFWQVDGVQKLTAAGLDTVNFIGGNNISITANGANTPQSIAFATSMTPTFTSVTFGNSTVNTTINSSAIAVSKIFANGVVGTAGKVLTANGTGGIYWGDAASGGGSGDLTIISDTFSGNGSNTVFTLSVSTVTDKTFVYLNGVLQTPTTDYSVANTTLTFITAPPSDNVIEVRTFDIPSVADLTVTSDNFTGNGSNTQFTLTTSLSSDETSLVFLNGVAQVPTTDYSISGSTLTFTAAPANGTNIQVTSYTAEDISTTTYTGNGSNTEFTLGTTSTTSKTVVTLNGVTQTPVADYSVSGATLVFAVAPANNDKIVARSIPSTASSTAGGNTHIQYNKSGSLGGSAGFTFNETTNNVTIGNTLTVPNLRINASNPPANSTSTGSTGTVAWDSDYLYVAVGTNTWKKTPITTDGAGGGGGSPGGSNTHIQYNDSNTFNGSAAFTFNEATNTVTLSNTLAIGSNVTVNTSTIFIGNSSVNTTITAGNVHLQGTQLTVGNVVLTGEQITIGNSTVNSVINSAGVALAGNATFSGHLMPSANITYDIGNSSMRWRDLWLSGTTINLGGATIKTDTDTGAIAFVPKSTAEVPNPKAVVVSPQGGIVTVSTTDGVPVINNSITTVDGISYGNSTVNTAINSSSVSTVTLNVGSNVLVNTSTIHLGNSTVNTVINTTGFTGNGAGLHGVNAAALEGNSVTNILTSANTAANTLAAAAFTNAASRADAAYSNAVSYAASNTYVNNTFLPLAGGTLTGNLTVNATANIVSNLSANNVTFRGDVQIDGNLVVSGTSITLNAASLAVEDNMIYLNNGSQVTHPDLGFAGNYNDGSYKHAGFFRDATDGTWKVFDGYTPEPDASAFIDTSNASFRIADFQANAITMASASLTGTLTVKAISSNGSVGTAGQLLASNGTSTYWINPPASTNVDAQYTWTNTHTFSNTVSIAGNLNFSSTGQRITGDMSNGTFTSRLAVQTNVTNAVTNFHIIPNGTAVGSGIKIEENNTFTNCSRFALDLVSNTDARISSGVFGTGTYLPVTIHTGGGEKFRVAANGNVGVGTATPGAKLSVIGTFQASGNATISGSYLFVGQDIRANGQIRATGWYNTPSSSSDGPAIEIGVSGGSGYILSYDRDASVYKQMIFNANSFNFQTQGTQTGTYISNSSATHAFFAANGNVGISTTSPVYKLDVVGGGRFTSTSNSTSLHVQSDHISGHSAIKVQGSSSNTAAIGFYDTAGVRKGLLWYDTGLMALEMASGTDFRISNATSNTVYFASNGNVGVGITTPGSKLTVADTIGIKHASVNAVQAIKATYWGYSTSYPVVMLGAASGGPTVSIGYDPINNVNGAFTGDGREILFRRGVRFVTPNSGDTAFNLQNLVLLDGSVAIGTDTPSDILTVHSTTADSYIRMNSSNVGNTGIKISYNGSSTHGIDLFYYPNNAQCYFDSKYQVTAGTVYGDIYFRQNVAGTMTTRMTIKADGGSVIVAGTLTENSSITLKENVNPITNAIDTISKLVGVTYDRKDGSAIQRPGLIAEEVDKILPNIVIKDENGAPSSIAYTNLIAYLVESIKELKAEIDILKGK